MQILKSKHMIIILTVFVVLLVVGFVYSYFSHVDGLQNNTTHAEQKNVFVSVVKKIASKITNTSVSEKNNIVSNSTGSGARIFWFSSPYDYINNPESKDSTVLFKEFMSAVGNHECEAEGGDGENACSLMNGQRKRQLKIIPNDHEYIYYAFPQSLGNFPPNSCIEGAMGLCSSVWIESRPSPLVLQDSNGHLENYYVYSYSTDGGNPTRINTDPGGISHGTIFP